MLRFEQNKGTSYDAGYSVYLVLAGSRGSGLYIGKVFKSRVWIAIAARGGKSNQFATRREAAYWLAAESDNVSRAALKADAPPA